MASFISATVTIAAAYHSYPVVFRQTCQAGTATVVIAARNIPARRNWPHMRMP